MTDDQVKMQAFVSNIGKARTLGKQLYAKMNEREKRAWTKMIGNHLNEITKSIDRIKATAAKRASPSIEEMFSI